jgi:hypothetical protein
VRQYDRLESISPLNDAHDGIGPFSIPNPCQC